MFKAVQFVKGFVKSNEDKDAPYMAPFIDTLDLVRPATYEFWKETGRVEAHSTSYIQGTTWDNEFIIFDEIQNWDLIELQAGLTRVGKGSKIVLAGSDRQVVNKKIKRIKGLLPYEVYMEHFRGDPRIMFHELKNVYRGWFAEKADSIDETIKKLELEE